MHYINKDFQLGKAFNKHYALDCEDINKDYCDYNIFVERVAAGANTTNNAFLFNPVSKKFELSKLFSGTNITYVSARNRISSFWKMGTKTP